MAVKAQKFTSYELALPLQNGPQGLVSSVELVRNDFILALKYIPTKAVHLPSGFARASLVYDRVVEKQ
jgi:hypothetical protein